MLSLFSKTEAHKLASKSFFRAAIALILVGLLQATALTVLAPAASAAAGDPGSIKFPSPRTSALTLAQNTAFSFGTGDFTIEYWWKPTVNTRSDVLDFQRTSSAANTVTRLDIGQVVSGTVQIYMDNAGGTVDSNIALASILNKWTHVAATREGNFVKLWVNGALQGSLDVSGKSFGGDGFNLSIMKDGGAGANGSGNLSSVRVVKGSAVYTGAFTPSRSALPKITGTQLLLNTPQGADFLKDSSDNNFQLTQIGTPLSDTSNPAIQSVCFDNSSTAAYVDADNAANAVGASDFTLETWLKLSSASAALTLLNGHSANNGSGSLNLFFNGQPSGTNSHVAFSTSGAETRWGNISADTWVHVAYVRQNSLGKLYLNGIPSTKSGNDLVASVPDATNYTSSKFRIGYPLTGTWPRGFTGCLAGLSLTKSALYTANFAANLPYPGERSVPTEAVFFMAPTNDSISNMGSGASSLTVTGAVTYSSDLPFGAPTIASATIAGTPTYGQVLTASAVDVAGSPTSTTYQWKRGGVTIAGATSSTYPLVAADVTSAISVAITVASSAGSSTATSAATSPVAKQTLTITGLSGINKEFDGSDLATAGGTPVLVGAVGSDDVLLLGTPIFRFDAPSVGVTKTVSTSGLSLTGATAASYTLTAPTLVANVTPKPVRVVAGNITVALGSAITPSFSISGLVGTDAVSSVSYTYSVTGSSTAPTAVGSYSVTASNANFSLGSGANYSVAYDAGALTILSRYVVTYNANGGTIAGNATSTADFVIGDEALTLPTATRSGFTFSGWFDSQTNGVQITGPLTPSSTSTVWAHWVQNSLLGIAGASKIGTITTLAGVGNTYSATSSSGTVAVTYVADALTAGTVIDVYQMNNATRASTLISEANSYVLSLVVAWLTPSGTVPILDASRPLTMVITDPAIKKGAKVYSLVGNTSTLLGVASIDGSVSVNIFEDPEVYIAITKSDAPTGVTATSAGPTSATISWLAQVSDGGSAVTSYTATSSGGQSCSSATLSCLITGLATGTAYTFTVTATNALGISASSSVSAAHTPVVPVIVSAPVTPPVIVVGPVTPPGSVVLPKPAMVKATVSKFAAGSAALNASVKSQVLSLLKKHGPRLKAIQCIGYSAGPTVLKSDAKVALNRAKAVCQLIAKLRPDVVVVSASGRRDNRVGVDIRRVEVSFK